MSSECGICYVKVAAYNIQCNSTVPHQICHDCECSWRLKSKSTIHGRTLICPFCRKEETTPGLRSHDSYKAELKLLYQELYGRRTARSTAQVASELQAEARARAAAYTADIREQVRAHARAAAEFQAQERARASLVIRSEVASRALAARAVRPPSPPYVPVPVPVPAPAVRTRMWCKNKNIACTTRSATPRICTYPGGCTEHVCRSCKMCRNHFQPFQPALQAERREIFD